MRELSHMVTAAESGRTVKSLALKALRLSQGQFSSLKFQGGIWVDGAPARATERLREGQVLSARLQDAGQKIAPAAIPISIPWQDGDYLIVEKPAPLPTLPSCHQAGPTLENALYAALECPGNFVFRPVNRLDKGTSGLMAVALNAHAQQLLQRQLHSPGFIREYLAVCEGHPPQESGVIDAPIGLAGEGVRREVRMDGKTAVTHYRLVVQTAERSVLRLRLETGRTHQIRVHLRHLGCPIVGDYLYGRECPALPGRFALHACFLAFDHPLTGQRVALESPLPEALAALMRPAQREANAQDTFIQPFT